MIIATKISTDQLRYLCEESIRGGCEGHRAEIAAARIALASAALEDSQVRADDLRLAVKLAIVPRSLFQPRQQDEDDELIPPPPPPPKKQPKPENNQNEDEKGEDEKDDERDENEEDKEDDKDDENEEDEQEEPEQENEPSVPEEFMFDAVPVDMQDDMMKFGGRQKTGKGLLFLT